ncbi:MAG: GH92 family glycosyl hydrolase [Solirubrobacterales bacterium]
MKLSSPHSKKLFAVLLTTALTLAVLASTGIGTAAGQATGTTASQAYEAVNPWIGTYKDTTQNKGNSAYGNTWPGATMPFGMTQFTPTTYKTENGEASGGYEYSADELRGFGMTRLSGTGCEGTNSAFDIPLLPYTGTVGSEGEPTVSPGTSISNYYLPFKHENEESSPGYYKVGLEDGVEAQLGATLRTTVGQFAYPASGSSATMLLNASGSNNDSGETQVTIDPATRTISGYTTSKTVCSGGTYRIYFSSEFDTEFAHYGTWSSNTVTASGTEVTSSAGKDQAGAYVSFAAGSTVTVRTGISYVSVEGATENREAEAPESKSFETVRAEAREAWEEALGTVSISTSSETERSIFYTALYHALLQPNIYDDVDGKYRAYGAATTMSSEVKELATGQEHEYATYSGWDQYRGQSQLIALLFPKVGSDIAQSITDLATQSGHWYNWPHLGSGQNKMNGDALETMVASYAAFGDTEFEEQKALESMVSTQSLPGTGSTRTGLLSNVAVGWIEDRTENSASTNLEYATADFGIAQLAKELGDTKDAENFMTRAQHWQNLVSPTTHAIVPRDRSGYWSQFDLAERSSEANKVNSADVSQQFDQSTGYQYQWSVPFDVTRLIEKLGGKAEAKSKLETLLTTLDAGVYDVTGDYLSNEPAFITPWIYSWLGEPDKTTATLDRVRAQLYSDEPGGLQGNDDLGSLSSYYVWSSLGLYPAIYGRSELLEAAPAFESIEINSLGSDRSITISAPGAATERDVTTTKVDGVESQHSWLPESFAQDGGTLEYTLGETASSWGTGSENIPPSYDEGTNGYNGIATTKDGTVSGGALEFSGNSLSREKLAAKGLVPGEPVPIPTTASTALQEIEFTWPDTEPGEFDSWVPHGQVVPMNDVRASEISFLGLATNGPSTGTAKVVYSDGTSQEVAVNFTDWTPSAISYGNTIVAQVSGRNTSAGGSDTTAADVFATTPVTLESTKLVEEVILPENVTSGIEHIFAVGVHSLAIPTMSVTPDTVDVGESLSVTGAEFTPEENVELTLSGSGGTVATSTAVADASGDISTTFYVPGSVPSSTYTLTVTGEESGYPLTAEVTVSGFAPAITATGSVETGGTIDVSLSGFAPEEEVTLSFDGTSRTLEADEEGAASTTLTAPATAGTYEVVAVGAFTETPVSEAITVTAPASSAGETTSSSGGSSSTGTSTSSGSTTTSSSKTKTKTTTAVKVSSKHLSAGKKVTVTVTVSPSSTSGKVAVYDGSKVLKTLTLKKGKAEVTLKLARGSNKLSARFLGSSTAAASKSKTVTVKVGKAH